MSTRSSKRSRRRSRARRSGDTAAGQQRRPIGWSDETNVGAPANTPENDPRLPACNGGSPNLPLEGGIVEPPRHVDYLVGQPPHGRSPRGHRAPESWKDVIDRQLDRMNEWDDATHRNLRILLMWVALIAFVLVVGGAGYTFSGRVGGLSGLLAGGVLFGAGNVTARYVRRRRSGRAHVENSYDDDRDAGKDGPPSAPG